MRARRPVPVAKWPGTITGMAAPTRIGGPALAALLPDLRTLPGPVYSTLTDAITALVLDGRVATETRLPSERELATALRISRATVTAAYDGLRETGFLASRTGSGSFVTVPRGATPHNLLSRWTTVAGEPGEIIDLSCAALPAPPDRVAAATTTAAGRLAPYLLANGYEPAGLPVLREAIAARFTARGVPTRAEQILVTNGALHGLDLLLRLLVGPGERVVTELPTYPGALDAVRANGGRLVPVPLAPDGGWDTDQLRATLRQTAARVAYLTPDFHNPTGVLVPDADRKAVLETARQTGTTVVVDESFVHLGLEGTATPVPALDPSVVAIGSLSKFVWGGLRIGWVRASVDLVHRLAALRTSIDMGGAVLDQVVAAILMDDLDEIVADRLRDIRPRRDALTAALRRDLPDWRFVEPHGGLSLWAELPAPLSTPLTLMAAQAGVILVPGSRFGVDGTLERFLRIPFALPVDRLDEAVRRLARVWTQLDDAATTTGLGARRLVVA
jgi:DNA-binding transcriptional MocR family regulator